MKLKEWITANGFSDAAFAKLISELAGRNIRPQSIAQWKNGTMPAWDAGEAISKITGGKVTPKSLA